MAKKKAQSINDLDKLEQYLAESWLLKLCSIIVWSIDFTQQTRFLLLLVMAIDIFFIPAISFKPEQVFSRIKYIITLEHASLKLEIIEALECIKSWFAAELFTKKDLNQALENEILKV